MAVSAAADWIDQWLLACGKQRPIGVAVSFHRCSPCFGEQPWNGIAPGLCSRVSAPPEWRPSRIGAIAHEHVQQGHQDLPVGPAHRHAGDRRDRPPVRRRRRRQHRGHRRARHRRRQEGRQARPGLLPADRRLHREDLRRRQDPRQLLQARRPPERARDADLAPDRPPAPAAVPRRLLQRSAGRHPRAVAEPRGRGRHRRADRRQRGAGDLRHSVQRPDRRRARRLHQRRSTC